MTANHPGVTVSLPSRLWRIEFLFGYGSPDEAPYERRHQHRTFADTRAAVRFLERTLAVPEGHHILLGLWRAEGVRWEPVDGDDLLADLAYDVDDPGPEEP